MHQDFLKSTEFAASPPHETHPSIPKLKVVDVICVMVLVSEDVSGNIRRTKRKMIQRYLLEPLYSEDAFSFTCIAAVSNSLVRFLAASSSLFDSDSFASKSSSFFLIIFQLILTFDKSSPHFFYILFSLFNSDVSFFSPALFLIFLGKSKFLMEKLFRELISVGLDHSRAGYNGFRRRSIREEQYCIQS